MDQIQIVEEAQLPKKAKVVIGVPDAGLVGLISATFLIDNLSMEEVASVESDLFPPIVILHNGYPKSPMRIYGKDDLLVAISEIAIHPNVQRQILRELMEWVKGIGASLSIGLSGAPVPNRMDIDRPKVYGVAVNVDGKLMEKMGVEPLQEAMLAGPYAVLLETCRKENYPKHNSSCPVPPPVPRPRGIGHGAQGGREPDRADPGRQAAVGEGRGDQDKDEGRDAQHPEDDEGRGEGEGVRAPLHVRVGDQNGRGGPV